jgi:hypothetical protein
VEAEKVEDDDVEKEEEDVEKEEDDDAAEEKLRRMIRTLILRKGRWRMVMLRLMMLRLRERKPRYRC